MAKEFNLKEYIRDELPLDSIRRIYKLEKIDTYKNDLFRDFSKSITYTVLNTYLGNDFMNEVDCENHLNWAFNKTKEEFIDLNLNITNDGELRVYFMEFMFDVFYMHPITESYDSIDNNINKLWDFLFNTNLPKSKSDIDTHIEIYKLFEMSLKS